MKKIHTNIRLTTPRSRSLMNRVPTDQENVVFLHGQVISFQTKSYLLDEGQRSHYSIPQQVTEYDQKIPQSDYRPTHCTVRKSHRTFTVTRQP